MGRSGVVGFLWSGWRRFATAAVLLLAAYLAIDAVAGRDLRVWWTLRDYGEEPEETVAALRGLGLDYRGALRRALLRGGRRFDAEVALGEVVLGAPYYSRVTLVAALAEKDPLVRRAAAVVLLRHARPERRRTVPDEVLPVIREWTSHPRDPWMDLGLNELARFQDPRLVPGLVALVGSDSTEGAESLEEIGRANENRALAARRLGPYVAGSDRVVRTLREVLDRERESEQVRIRAAQALLLGGYAGDPSVYEHLANSESDVLRQVLADNLERVDDPRVVPILEKLLYDRKDTVRRGAVNSLMKKRVPRLLEEIWFLAEDEFTSIKGDLATAVGLYRRKDLVPYLLWCLEDFDPVVVEKAYVELVRLTREHHGFTDAQWERYRRGGYPARAKLIGDFVNDARRKEEAIRAWAEKYPPRYRDADRVPRLVRMLGHADPENVRRAIRELARITKRTAGLPPLVLHGSPDVQAEADQLHRFMTEEREAVIEDWKSWCEKSRPPGEGR